MNTLGGHQIYIFLWLKMGYEEFTVASSESRVQHFLCGGVGLILGPVLWLRIQLCHSCGSDLIPGLGTSICCGCGHLKKKKKKKKKEGGKKMGYV